MAFSDWDSYTALLDNLAQARSNWSDASDFAEFDAKVRQNCAALVPNAGGYDELVTRLDESDDYGDNDALFGHLRIVILAEAANVDELGADWSGYWISTDNDDAQIYADSRSAALSAWTAMDDVATDEPVTDDVDEAELVADADADEQQQEFDQASGRWRRRADDDVYEYYEESDDVWERVDGELWTRYHDGAQLWLPYNGPSSTWLYQDAWVAYEEIVAVATVGQEPDLPASDDDDEEDLDVLAERLVAETLAEAIAEVRRELEKERAQ